MNSHKKCYFLIKTITFLHEWTVDREQLKAVLTVAAPGNVTRASALLNVVQPAMSRQLRLSEEDLGTNLFGRSSQGMALTETCEELVECKWLGNPSRKAEGEGNVGGRRPTVASDAATVRQCDWSGSSP